MSLLVAQIKILRSLVKCWTMV